MNKIPVWKTIRFAYAFTFGDIGTIIGLIWLPTLLIAVLQFLPYALGTQEIAQTAGENPALVAQDPGTAAIAVLANLAFFAGTLLFYAMNAVAVMRQALGLRQGGATVHFALGAAEWRMLGANLFCFFILGVAIFVYFQGIVLAASLADKMTAPLAVVALLYMGGGAFALIYVGLRLVFLVVPVVVAEEKIDLARGWTMMAGNVWRVLAVILAISVPLLIIQAVCTVVIGGQELIAPLPAGQDAMASALKLRMAALDRHMPELIGLFLILAPFNFGLMLGAEAAVYRALKPPQGIRQ